MPYRHQGDSVAERVQTAYRVGIERGLKKINIDASNTLKKRYNIQTNFDTLFKLQRNEDNIEVTFPSVVRWHAQIDERTCDRCKSLNGTYWIFDDTSVMNLKPLESEGESLSRLGFHEAFHRSGPCRCTLDDITDDVENWWFDYYSKHGGAIYEELIQTMNERFPNRTIEWEI